MKFYFVGSISGGRAKVDDYARIVEKLKQYGSVLTEHVADPNLSALGEQGVTPKQVYLRDMEWMREADMVFAEVSTPSIGVGYELATAENLGKKIFCFYDIHSTKRLTSMISGNKHFKVLQYSDISQVIEFIDKLNLK